ncbi:MAG: MerR family transcriptional regulator [Chloroflexota bacterium]
MSDLMTIGRLAKQMGVRTSTLRFYEKEGLIEPDGRSESGYRLYKPEAAEQIQLIQRAQRVGFSLADIRLFLNNLADGSLSNEMLIKSAEQRFYELEKEVTQKLILRHELTHFLQDLYHHEAHDHAEENTAFGELIDRICPHPEDQPTSQLAFEQLLQQHGCVLTSSAGQRLLDDLRGQHVHIWQEGEGYQILVISQDEGVESALQSLADMEASCHVHADFRPELSHNAEGFLLTANGENGFLFARLFLVLADETL